MRRFIPVFPVIAFGAICLVLAAGGCAGTRIVRGHIERDGRPFFPVEVYSLSSPEDVRQASRLGFNSTINEFPDLMREAARLDFAVTVPDWFENSLDCERLDRRIELYRPLKGVWAWSVGDEPELRAEKSPPELVAKAARYLRQRMPSTAICLTLSGARDSTRLWPEYLRDVDFVRVAAYPLAEDRGAQLVYERVSLARELGAPRPVIAVLDSWNMPGKPYRTIEGLRLDLYAALAAGARGVSIYKYERERWADKEGKNDLAVFIREVRSLGSLVAKAQNPAFSQDEGLKRLDFRAGWSNFTVAVNLGETSKRLSLPLEWAQRCWRARPGLPAEEIKGSGRVCEEILRPEEAAIYERGFCLFPSTLIGLLAP